MVDLLHKDLPPPHEAQDWIDGYLGKELLVFLRFLVTLQYCSTVVSAPVISESMVQ